MIDTLNNKVVKEGLTYDDVLLVPNFSQVLPSDTNLKTKLTKNITLNIPMISAAMDTVTEAKLAISLARQGGIGIIHKNMSIEEQAHEVEKVKKSESGMILDPVTLGPDDTIRYADHLMGEYKISGLPVVENKKLVGIITNRDLKYRSIDDTLVKDVMTTKDIITGKVGVSLDQAKTILLENKIEKLPIVDWDNNLCGLITIKDIDSIVDYPNACKDEYGRLRCGAAISNNVQMLQRTKALVEAGVDVVVLDSAHGHSKGIIDGVKKIKENFPNLEIIAGNIVTGEAALALSEAGCSAVKVGVGPGSICTTRVVAGVGVPQLSAVSEVVEALKGTNVGVIADGGIKYSGDIVKAMAVGASAVMMGSIFAGCSEAPGEEVIVDGRRFKVYVGMGSLAAMNRGSADRYFQNSSTANKLVPEGIEGRVPIKGSINDVIFQLMGGLRSGMGYCGAATIPELFEVSRFVKISGAGLKESHPHTISISKEAPNYTNK